MPNRLNMLFTSAGRRVSLIDTFRSDANLLDIDLHITAADVDPCWSSACLIADATFCSPPSHSPNFAEELLRFSKHAGITLIVPTNDGDLLPLALARDRFEDEGIHVVISDPSFINATNDKLKTFSLLREHELPTPCTWSLQEGRVLANFDVREFIAKPRYGSSGKGFTPLRNRLALDQLAPGEDWLIQERLYGAEYTVNVLIGANGKVEAAVPHRRRNVRAGEVEKGFTEDRHDLQSAMEGIFNALGGAQGPVCVQLFAMERNLYSILEINARFGGGYPLTHAAGCRFGEWILAEHLNLPRPNLSQWINGFAMVRYDSAVYFRMEEGQ